MKFFNGFIILLLFSGISFGGELWVSKNGSLSDFSFELEQKEGLNRLFNCDFLIEKVKFEDKDKYWLTIEDDYSGNNSVLSFDHFENSQEYPISQGYLFTKEIGYLGIKKQLSLRIKKDFLGEWVELQYREFISNPFTITKNIKCAAQR